MEVDEQRKKQAANPKPAAGDTIFVAAAAVLVSASLSRNPHLEHPNARQVHPVPS